MQDVNDPKYSIEAMEKKWADAIAKAGVMTEAQMREHMTPRLENLTELTDYIEGLVARPHDYGTCVYAMALAAQAAFGYVAKELEVSGAQYGMANLEFLRRVRRMEHGFQIVNFENLLYPQYWNSTTRGIFLEVLSDPDNAKRFGEAAKKLLEEGHGADTVRDHWQWLADVGDRKITVLMGP